MTKFYDFNFTVGEKPISKWSKNDIILVIESELLNEKEIGLIVEFIKSLDLPEIKKKYLIVSRRCISKILRKNLIMYKLNYNQIVEDALSSFNLITKRRSQK